MSESRCLCQLCSCGRHKCSPKTQQLVPCECMTNYRNEYVAKPIVETPSCRPDRKPVQSDAPCDSITTTRRDYTRHPCLKPYKQDRETYQPPEGALECMTSYRREYISDAAANLRPSNSGNSSRTFRPGGQSSSSFATRPELRDVFDGKPLDPVKAVHQKERTRVVGKFNDETTHRVDYKKVKMPPMHRHVAEPYLAPADPFTGNSSYRTTYLGKTAPVRESLRPPREAVESDAPLDDLTTSRAAFIRHPLSAPQSHPPQEWCPNPAVLDGLTNYRAAYTMKGDGRRPSYKPDNGPMQSDAPFIGATTQRCDFTVWPVQMKQKHSPDTYKPPDAAMSDLTSHRLAYTVKPIEKVAAFQPAARKQPAGKFDDLTTSRCDYHSWGNVERPKKFLPEPYRPMAEPFDGMATYKVAYIRHCEPRRESFAPPRHAVQSDAPLQDHTEYRNSYTRKPMEQCLAGVLKAGGRCGGPTGQDCYSFKEMDLQGHEWYDKDPPGGDEIAVNG